MRRFVSLLTAGAISSAMLLHATEASAFEPLPSERTNYRAGSNWDAGAELGQSMGRSRPSAAANQRATLSRGNRVSTVDYQYATEENYAAPRLASKAEPGPLKSSVKGATSAPTKDNPFGDDPLPPKSGKSDYVDEGSGSHFAPPPGPTRGGGRVNSSFDSGWGNDSAGCTSCGEGSCGCDTCDDCDDCCGLGCVQDKLYVRAEYLMWWSKGDHMVPLVTSAPTGTPASEAGVLGQPGTVVLFGNENVNNDLRSGLRITAGWWLDSCHTTAIEGSLLGLEDNGTDYFVNSVAGAPIIARPFFNAQSGVNAAQLIGYPGVSTDGFVHIDAENKFWTGNVGIRKLMRECCDDRLDFVAGYRYARLEDSLLISDSLTSAGGQFPGGTIISGFDAFDTENDFNGGEFGLSYESRRQRMTIRLLGKVALGNIRQRGQINGSTTVTDPLGGSITTPGGLLTQPSPSNIGDYSRDRFGVMPEAGVSLNYAVSCNLTASIGYSFLYMSNVVRAGEQVDPALNPTVITPPIVGPVAPQFSWNEAGYWAQGVNFGLEYKF